MKTRKQIEFNYELQVWVVDGIVQPCGHPETMKGCCNARKYAGLTIQQAVESK